MTHSEIVSFIWSVADLIRDTFKRGKYQDVILPLTVLRRLDCVMEPTRGKVWKRQKQLTDRKLKNLDAQLRRASGLPFYNTSRYDFKSLLEDAPHLPDNLRNYIAGFSPNMREVLEHFGFNDTISRLHAGNLLFQVMEKFKNLDLHPDRVDNAAMGMIFEELIRRFNEALNENPGEHFTPRDVIHLMVDLMLAGDERNLRQEGTIRTIYDPCCGSGGMLLLAKQRVTAGWREDGKQRHPAVNKNATIYLFGQEVNPETWAIARSDMYIKDPSGEDADRIGFGSTLSKDCHERPFDYLIANPPYGKDWKRDEATVRQEHERGAAGRFGPGLPRISDGQTLFLLHMLAHMKEPNDGGSRIALIMNGSPLFSGDAGSGESEIRRYVLEHDLLEALVALPEQLFYNTGIATYVWVLTNRKAAKRKGKVQLINASSFWTPMRKSLGDKRRSISPEQSRDILKILKTFQDGETRHTETNGETQETTVSRIYPNRHFGFRKITVERPLRLNFKASPERLERLKESKAFQKLAKSRKRGAAGEAEKEKGRALQKLILEIAESLPKRVVKDREKFARSLDAAVKRCKTRLSPLIKRAILQSLAERDSKAAICLDANGNPEPDPELRDTETVPLLESVEEFFEHEVLEHFPDAWIDANKRDPKDGEIGIVGYEISFNRYFYQYKAPRNLDDIEKELRETEEDIVAMLGDLYGRNSTKRRT